MITMIDKDEERTGNNYSKANAFAPSTRIINGYGDTLNLSDPELAIYRFYKAFNEKDIATMTRVWANTEDITAENPAGGIRRGWSDLKWVYDKVLGSPAKVRAEFYDYTIHEAGDVFWSVGRERIFLNLSGEDTTLNVRITRIFRMIDGIWRLVHLHGSFEDPNMLLRYQQATGSGDL